MSIIVAFFHQAILMSTFSKALPSLIILAITISIIVYLVAKPKGGFTKLFNKKNKYQTLDDKYNEERKELELTIDQILDKIHKKGLHSLSKREKEILTRHSEKK